MTRDEIVSLLRRRQSAWDTHDAAGMAAVYTETAVAISPTGGVLEGPDEIARVNRTWFTAFPDVTWRSDDIIVDGDRVVEVAQFSGTHAGEFFGVPATGRRVDVQMVMVMTLVGGRIAEERRIYDFTGFLVQVGVLKAKPVA